MCILTTCSSSLVYGDSLGIAVSFETGPFTMIMSFQQSIVNISAALNPEHLKSRQGALPAPPPHDMETEPSNTHCICSFTLYEGVRLCEAEIYAEILCALQGFKTSCISLLAFAAAFPTYPLPHSCYRRRSKALPTLSTIAPP